MLELIELLFGNPLEERLLRQRLCLEVWDWKFFIEFVLSVSAYIIDSLRCPSPCLRIVEGAKALFHRTCPSHLRLLLRK